MWQGYALIEYESFEEAQAAIRAMNGTQLLTKTIFVDWAFSRGPIKNFMSTRYGVSHDIAFFICSISSFALNRWPCTTLHKHKSCPKCFDPIMQCAVVHKLLAFVKSYLFFEVPQLRRRNSSMVPLFSYGCVVQTTDQFLMLLTGHHARDLGLHHAGLLPWRLTEDERWLGYVSVLTDHVWAWSRS